MDTPDRNLGLTPLLRAVTFIEVVVLFGAGFGLFFLPDLARELWPWPPAPFNTRFLGSIYLTALLPVAVMLIAGRWAPARGVLPAIFIFTTIVLFVSVFNFDLLDFQRWSTHVWFVLYIILPINSAYHMGLYRRLPPAEPIPTPPAWRAYLLGVSIVLGLYSMALLIAPETFTGFWPWKIDAFHGRMYSAAFASGAVGAWVAARVAARIEFFTAGITQATFGLFSILGLVLVDAAVHRVDWSQPGTWVWVGAFAVMLIASIGMIGRVRGMRGAS